MVLLWPEVRPDFPDPPSLVLRPGDVVGVLEAVTASILLEVTAWEKVLEPLTVTIVVTNSWVRLLTRGVCEDVNCRDWLDELLFTEDEDVLAAA